MVETGVGFFLLAGRREIRERRLEVQSRGRAPENIESKSKNGSVCWT
jgi:hypothetical protein